MENLIAIIKNNKVYNIIVASDDFAKNMQDQTVNVTGTDCAIDYTYDGNNFTPPQKTREELEEEGRLWRDKELKATDFIVQITDYPNYSDWLTYRENLRNWPETDNFPETKPNAPTEL